MNHLIQIAYLLVSVAFIYSLRKMSSPLGARGGMVVSGVAMLLAFLVTLLVPGLTHYGLMIIAVIIGGVVAWVLAKRVKMTQMPQMIALYNGLGGGAAAAIAMVELLPMVQYPEHLLHEPAGFMLLGVAGAVIGSVALTGSIIAFLKLNGNLSSQIRFKCQRRAGLVCLAVALVAALIVVISHITWALWVFYLAALLYGVLLTLPIGGADMPVVISLFNALTGLAVGFEGYVLGNFAMVVAGTVVGASGTMLTQLMAKAMNRSLLHVLFGQFGQASAVEQEHQDLGELKESSVDDAAVLLAYAQKVIFVPGYGMAVAKAQFKLAELVKILIQNGIEVKFAIHPVAGRMPGHMNVLLAEAGIDYDLIEDMEDINPDFAHTDVAVIIGANDVVNPAAVTQPDSPIFGMPILKAMDAKNILVLKRGQGKGFSGLVNALFYGDKTKMLYGDAQKSIGAMVSAIKVYLKN